MIERIRALRANGIRSLPVRPPDIESGAASSVKSRKPREFDPHRTPSDTPSKAESGRAPRQSKPASSGAEQRHVVLAQRLAVGRTGRIRPATSQRGSSRQTFLTGLRGLPYIERSGTEVMSHSQSRVLHGGSPSGSRSRSWASSPSARRLAAESAGRRWRPCDASPRGESPGRRATGVEEVVVRQTRDAERARLTFVSSPWHSETALG